MKISICVSVAVWMCLCFAAHSTENAGVTTSTASHYNVGLAKIDITPDYSIRQNGFLSRKQESAGVRQRIWAKAMAIDFQGQPPAVLITVDNLGVPDEITQAISKLLQSKRQLAIERLSIAASHTHSAPMINGCTPNIFGMPIPAAEQQRIDRYTQNFIDKLVQVAVEALDHREPSTLHFEIGRVSFAKNRRSPTGPIDHDLPVLAIRDLGGKLRAIHTNYACHCVTLSDNLISGDWGGYAQEHIERAHSGAIALLSIGCGADQNPKSGVVGDQFDVASQQGLEISNEVDRVLGSEMRQVEGPLTIQYERVDLALAELPSREQMQATGKLDTPVGYHARVQLAKLDRGESLRTKISYPIQTWAFGDSLSMVFMAGEVVVDYSKRIKTEFDATRLLLCAYSNAAPCYIPSERVLKEGGYEGASAMIYYDQPTKFASGLEDKILSVVHKQLADRFSAKETSPKNR
ncbi:MAG: neutral/alkaline non-lysosomal ceramidase N-terminal domain-containing protein [Pirellula sp.]